MSLKISDRVWCEIYNGEDVGTYGIYKAPPFSQDVWFFYQPNIYVVMVILSI